MKQEKLLNSWTWNENKSGNTNCEMVSYAKVEFSYLEIFYSLRYLELVVASHMAIGI